MKKSMAIKDIDFEYRPETYWPQSLNQEKLIAKITGQDRRELARRILEEDGFAALSEFLGRSELTDEERYLWGYMHPSHMGGEYLPSPNESEVEIARISLRSTTGDQISLRASSAAEGITYQIVDEYETRFTQSILTSKSPLTLQQLITQIDESKHPEEELDGGLLISNWEHMYDWGENPHESVAFARIESAYYPQLGEYYRLCSRRWRFDKFQEMRRNLHEERLEEHAKQLEQQKRREKLSPFADAIEKMVSVEFDLLPPERQQWRNMRKGKLRLQVEEFVLKHGRLPENISPTVS